MVTGKTASGFVFSINSDKFKDARFLLSIAKIEAKRDEFGYILLIEQILGEDLYEDLCKHCEDENGIPDIEKVIAEYKEIMDAVKTNPETKN